MTTSRLSLKRPVGPVRALPVTWHVDCPAPGVVIVDVALGDGGVDVPLHWRSGDWSKPPLDVRLSTEGEVQGIQLVFQDEVIEEGEAVPPSDIVVGVPTFDVAAWPADRYHDVRVPVSVRRLPSGHLYAVIGDSSPSSSVTVAPALRFDLDDVDHLAGIAVGPLTDDDWHVIEASAPPDGS